MIHDTFTISGGFVRRRYFHRDGAGMGLVPGHLRTAGHHCGVHGHGGTGGRHLHRHRANHHHDRGSPCHDVSVSVCPQFCVLYKLPSAFLKLFNICKSQLV